MTQTNSEKKLHAEWEHPKLLQMQNLQDYKPTQEAVETYYNTTFWKEFRAVYGIDKTCAKYPILFLCKDKRVGNLPITFTDATHYHLFSQGVFFVSLCSQVVGKLYGWDAMVEFMVTYKQPLIDCYMAGLRHPLFVMRYIELFALEEFESDYIDLLDLSLRYFINKMSEYHAQTHISVDAVIDEMIQQVELLKQWVANPDTPYPDVYVEQPRDF